MPACVTLSLVPSGSIRTDSSHKIEISESVWFVTSKEIPQSSPSEERKKFVAISSSRPETKGEGLSPVAHVHVPFPSARGHGTNRKIRQTRRGSDKELSISLWTRACINHITFRMLQYFHLHGNRSGSADRSACQASFAACFRAEAGPRLPRCGEWS
jgi:hypothetical protein